MGIFTLAHKMSKMTKDDRDEMFTLENIDEIKPFLTH